MATGDPRQGSITPMSLCPPRAEHPYLPARTLGVRIACRALPFATWRFSAPRSAAQVRTRSTAVIPTVPSLVTNASGDWPLKGRALPCEPFRIETGVGQRGVDFHQVGREAALLVRAEAEAEARPLACFAELAREPNQFQRFGIGHAPAGHQLPKLTAGQKTPKGTAPPLVGFTQPMAPPGGIRGAGPGRNA